MLPRLSGHEKGHLHAGSSRTKVGAKIATSNTFVVRKWTVVICEMADPRSQRRVTGLMSHIFPRAAGVASVFSDARSEKTTVAETVVETPEKLSLRAKARVSGTFLPC